MTRPTTTRPTPRTVELPACIVCGRPLPRSRSVRVIGDGLAHHLNSRCPGDSRKAHAAAFPDCHIEWHDLWDHPGVHCAGNALAITLARHGWDYFTTWLDRQGQTR